MLLRKCPTLVYSFCEQLLKIAVRGALLGVPTFLIFLILATVGAATGLTNESLKFFAQDAGSQDLFGVSVDIKGEEMIFGAPGNRAGGIQVGAAYVYKVVAGVWTFDQKLGAYDGQEFDGFGNSVAIEGDVAVVGANGVNTFTIQNQGAAYVFVRNNGVWGLVAKLLPPSGTGAASFGSSVAISNGTIAVGSPVQNPGAGFGVGAVFIYTQVAGVWTQQDMLFSTDPADRIGTIVDIDNDTVITGSPITDVNGHGHQGVAMIFKRTANVWGLQQKIFGADGNTNDNFGQGVSVHGDTVVVSAPNSDLPGGLNQGAVYAFARSGDVWSQQAKLTASDGVNGDNFGDESVAIWGDAVVVGTNMKRVGTNDQQGTAYMFIRSGTTWSERAEFVASDGAAQDNFGGKVAIDGARVLIGAPTDRITMSTQGSAYYFVQPIPPPDLETGSDTGASNTDNITNDRSPSFDIDGVTIGSTVQLVRDNTVVAATTAGSTAVTLTDPDAPTSGVFRYASRQIINNEESSPSPLFVTIDAVPPKPTVTTGSGPTRTQPIMFSINFDEPITALGAGALSLGGSTANVSAANVTLTGSGQSYQAQVGNITSDGTVVLSVLPGFVQDIAGNFNSVSVGNNIATFDTTGPTVTINQAVGQVDPARDVPINFRVVFNEPVTDFTGADIVFTGSTANTSSASKTVTGSGTSFNVAVAGITSNGGTVVASVRLGAAVDQAGNSSSVSTSTDNSVTLDNVTVQDTGFELNTPQGTNPNWSSTSTRFGTSLCTITSCGNGNQTASPRNGSGWAWFDGSDTTAAEQASVSQSVQLPLGGVGTLKYFLKIGAVNAPTSSNLQVKIDGTVVQSIPEPPFAETVYTQRTVDMSAYMDGGVHLISFEYNRPAGAASDNFTIDDVTLPTPALPVQARTVFDLDGDGKTDISIFRPGPGEWWYYKSSNGGNGAATFGSATDKITPADYTGDGKTDIAIWRPSTGEWFILRSEDNSYYSFPFGTGGDIPSPADYDADGKADAAVFRPSSATWFISKSSGGTTIQTFGIAGDVPVTADYDGDGKSDIAIYRPSLGEWWIQRSTAGLIAFTFGNGADKTVAGDYTGDGKADVGIWRPSTGEWFILRSEDQSYYSFPFGISTDIPSPGDYDGDGKFDAAVFRPSGSTWFVNKSGGGTLIQQFGQAGDLPVPNAFVR